MAEALRALRVVSTRRKYVPIKLGLVLRAHNITQGDLGAAVLQMNGKPLSPPTVNELLNWGTWPKSTPQHSIIEQTESFLRQRGVDERVIKTIWQEVRNKAEVRAAMSSRKTKTAPEPALEFDTEPEMLSEAAKKQFAVPASPFVNDVLSKDDVFQTRDIRYVREAMYIAAKLGGFIAVVGESGSGKTTLRRDLQERIEREKMPVRIIFPATIDKSRLTSGAICEAIIRDLEPTAKMRTSLEGKARQVGDLLLQGSRGGVSHVLMIEEAHDLGKQTLKQLKRFYELEHGFKKLLSIVLIGQPELRDLLDERTNYDAREVIRRIEVVSLNPLDKDLGEYLKLKFARVGVDVATVIEPKAYDAIRAKLTSRRQGNKAESHCYPLVVNNLVTKAMNFAADYGVPKVDAAVIEQL